MIIVMIHNNNDNKSTRLFPPEEEPREAGQETGSEKLKGKKKEEENRHEKRDWMSRTNRERKASVQSAVRVVWCADSSESSDAPWRRKLPLAPPTIRSAAANAANKHFHDDFTVFCLIMAPLNEFHGGNVAKNLKKK